jgi:tetratricopeptide (TPR) repeat protein
MLFPAIFAYLQRTVVFPILGIRMAAHLHFMETLNPVQATFAVDDNWTVSTTRFGSDGASAGAGISVLESTRLMQLPPADAEARARRLLEINPEEPQALCLLAASFRRLGRLNEARPILERLTQSQPQMEYGWRVLGLMLAQGGEETRATGCLLRAIDLENRGKDAWYALGDLLTFPSNTASYGEEMPTVLGRAQRALRERRPDIAENLIREWLAAQPRDVCALKLLADARILRSQWDEARSLLEICLKQTPDWAAARFRYATMLAVHGEFPDALPSLDELAISDPHHLPIYLRLKAETLGRLGRYEESISAFETLIESDPQQPGLWFQYGRMLRLQRRKDAASAFQRAVAILPSYFEAWFALATLKTFRWSENDIEGIRAQLARADLTVDDRALMHFVEGRALEDTGRRNDAFEAYRAGNEIRRRFVEWDAEPPTPTLIQMKSLFDAKFIRARERRVAPKRGPIFIVGMPRSGSTLVEQIVSSHSAVEGLGERPDFWAAMEQRLVRLGRQNASFPGVLGHLNPNDLQALGEDCLARMRALRTTQKPFFTDKQVSNYLLTGLIYLALPGAKIIDVRRHPLDCGISCYRHYFPAGQPYTSDLVEFGRRYVAYVELMAHFDAVLPGTVYRITYENLVANFETEIRRLLDFLGLPFEEQCLRFHENNRVVETLSFEQVATPLYETGVGQWRSYDRWLGPLKESLGYVLDAYPDVPEFYSRIHARLRKPLPLREAGDPFATVNGLRRRPFENAAITA